MRGHAWLLLALLLVVAAPASALEPALDSLERGERGRVVTVIDGDTVRLDNGIEVRLVGLQAPKLPLGRAGFKTWPLADEAKAALEEIALRRTVELRYGGRERDRHGRALAHLVVDGKGWAQGLMLERGMARVYSFPDNRALAAEMLALETAARAARRGIWSHPFYAVLTPEAAAGHIDDFALVEGRVLSVGGTSSRTYLNFGADFRTDFTVSVARRDRRAFEDAGLDLDGLEGHIIRVRGWLDSLNGPMIEATHPEQIELVP
ncbi:MAG: thermonuclease family protein [Alphaproteobacteria bacterium]